MRAVLKRLSIAVALPWAAAAVAADPVSVHGIAAQIDSPTPITLLDVRTPEEFAEGHIPGARNVPVSELPQRLDELDPKRNVAVYCEVGGRASRAVDLLEANGFGQVLQIEGSMRAWRAAELPVETAP